MSLALAALVRNDPRLLALLLLASPTGACTPGDADSSASETDPAASTSTDSASSSPTEADSSTSEPADSSTTDDPTESAEFPMCPEPDRADIGFRIQPFDFSLAESFTTTCTLSGAASMASPTWIVDLSCLDPDGVAQLFSIELELFYEPALSLIGADGELELRYYRRPLDFGEDLVEALSLRGTDGRLHLLLARGFGVLDEPPVAELAAPLQIATVDAPLCPAVGDCDTVRRIALDVTAGESTLRVFDRGWIEVADGQLGVHVGSATLTELNTTGECASDSPSGIETTIVIAGQDA